ncbi:MAG: nucleoside triphosphate pyrophosphatase [Elusimicrobiales bacterium]
MRLILASESPRRKKILKENGINFKAIPAKIREKTRFKRPHLIVMDLSYKKAKEISKKFKNIPVIGADTIVYCSGKIIGKPKNKKDAFKLLKFQSGKWQTVYTGITLIWEKKAIVISEYEKSYCYMKKMDDEKLKAISTKHLDKAGGWAVQDKNDILITKIKGRYDNVVGLPMNIVNKFLKIVSAK